MDVSHPRAGGSEIFTHEVAKRWAILGHEVTLICSKYRDATDIDEIDGVKVLRTGGRYSVHLKAKKIYERRFKGKIDVAIDEIITIPFFTPYYLREPKIALLHQLSRELLFFELPLPIAALGYFIEPRVMRIYGKTPIATVSNSSKASLIGVGIPEENIYMVPEGVDHKLYKPRKKSDDLCVAYIGSMMKYKRINDIVTAMKYVIKELPEAKLILAGRGNIGVAGLKRLVAKLELQDNVSFLGPIPEEEKLKLLAEIQLLVYTSVREGFGLSVLEAAACGTPAIAYDVPGLRDAVIHGKTGLLVPYKDIKALSRAIMMMLTDKALRTRLSENAYAQSLTFSWDRTAEEFMGIIRKFA